MKTKHLVEILGTKAEIARLLGITRGAVSLWGKTVPALSAYRLREILPRHVLRKLRKMEEQSP